MTRIKGWPANSKVLASPGKIIRRITGYYARLRSGKAAHGEKVSGELCPVRKSRNLKELKEKNLSINSRELREGKLCLTSLPLSLYVDVNLKCNLKCPSCFRSDPRNKDKVWPTMEFETFKEVARRLFPTAYRVILSGGGESLIHKHFDRMLELCMEYQVRPVLYTNGMALNKDRVTLLAQAGTYLAISIDGATKETFETFRYPARWEKLVKSLEIIKEVREEVGNQDFSPYLGVVVQKENLGQLTRFIDMAKEYGFEQIKYSKLDPYYPDLKEKVPGPEEAGREFVKVFEKANMNRIRIEAPDYGNTSVSERIRSLRKENNFHISLDKNNPDRFVKYPNFSSKDCSIPWSETMITPEGRVVVGCCSGFQFGNFSERPFSEIWNNEKYQELRRTVNSKEPMAFCKYDTCPFRK